MYPKLNTKSLQSLQSLPSGPHLLILFLKSSRLFKFFIFIGTTCLTFEAKNFIDFTPYLLLFTEFLKKSDWVCKLYFINLGGKMLLIISLERFCFILYSLIANYYRLESFCGEWWKNNLFEAIHEINLCCFYIQFVVNALVSDWFFYSILYHETSKLVGSSQTGFQWRISLGLSFVLESYNLTTLLKQTISYLLFYINLKRTCQMIMIYLDVTPIAFAY